MKLDPSSLFGFNDVVPVDPPEPAPLLQSVDFLQTALASAAVGVWRYDAMSGESLLDPVASRITGLPARPQGVQTRAFVHPDDLAEVIASAQASCLGAAPHDLEFRILRADRQVRWVHVSARPEPGAGLPTRILAGTIRDVTEARAAQARLRERERQLATLIDNLLGVAYRRAAAAPWPASLLSGGVEALTGHPAIRFLEQGLAWADIVHPEDRPALADALDAAIAAGEPFALTYRIRHATGEVRWIAERGRAVADEEGGLVLEGFIGDVTASREAEQRLAENETDYRHTIELSPQIPWVADAAARMLRIGTRWCAITGLPREAALGHGWIDAVHPEDLAVAQAAVAHSLASGEPLDMRTRLRSVDGGYRWIRSRGFPRRDAQGAILRWYGLSEDLHEQMEAEARLRESEALNRSIVEASTASVKLLDLDGRVIFVNGAGQRAIGTDSPELVAGRPWSDFWPEANRPLVEDAIKRARRGEVAHFAARRAAAGGRLQWWDVTVSPVLDHSGEPTRLLCISRDETRRRQAEEGLRWAADHDALTGIANRSLFQRRLDAAVAAAEADGGRVGLLTIDVDHFKQVNDSLGHDAGDMLLKTFAERLNVTVRPGDTVARLGGDEFAVVLPRITDQGELASMIAALLERMREPFVHAGRVLDCRASVGASLYPDHGSTSEELLKSADIALYTAKSRARGEVTIFRAEQRAELQQRASMLNVARDAIGEERILPYYQPKVALPEGAPVGLEALLRWRHARGGLQGPASIAAAFEDLELAAAISERITAAVIADMRYWLDCGIGFGHVAVNAAAAEFRRDGFAERLLERLRRAGVPTACFQLEVTETVFLGRGADYVDRALKLLSDEGVTIALDDFGTGYASLRHLKHYPVDLIKIDRSFVSGIDRDADDAAIVSAILNLGRSLGIEVVAEGIETPQQAERLLALGCRYGQGFLYSPAVPADRVPVLIRELRQGR